MATVGPFSFSGGYSPGYGYINVPQGMATEMRGARFRAGYVTPRWSNPKVNDANLGSGKFVIGMTTWNDAPNGRVALVAICNGKIYIGNVTNYAPTSTTITMTDYTGAVTVANSNTQRYTFASLNNILIGCGGSSTLFGTPPFKITAYNVNAAVLGGSPPNGDCVVAVNNFLFIGRQLGATNTWSRVNWSNVGDPETWTAGNFVDFNKSDGEAVMALGSIGTDLYIFKQTSIGRLSTYSQVISGAATLGPLQVVVKGLGCAGPLAIDNLPNGNIVFLGNDGHLYEFDGSTTSDLSKRPYPSVNCYDSSELARGIGIISPNTESNVKTWRGVNEVWVSGDSASSDPFIAFAYDIENRIWQGHMQGLVPKSYASMPISSNPGLYESSDTLFHGNYDGNIYAHGDYARTFPTDENGDATEWRVGTTIQVAKDFPEFIPRSLCVNLYNPFYSQILSFAVYVTYDTYFNGGSSVYSNSFPTAVLPSRIFVNLPMRQDSIGQSNNILPTMISVMFVCTFQNVTGGSEVLRLGEFFLSDEVIR